MTDRLRASDYRFIAVCLVLLAASTWFSVRYFYLAFPEASIDFRVGRSEARTIAESFLTGHSYQVSGYRTAATNRLLQREGWAPAAHSEHLVGKAADICVDHVSLRHLHRAAVSFKAGGVGMYPRDHFIHVDVGPPRVW